MNVPTEDEVALYWAHQHAKGKYQHNILDGVETLSGSTLRGRAKEYYGRYRHSAASVVKQVQADLRLSVHEEIGKHNRRNLVIEMSDYGRRIYRDPRVIAGAVSVRLGTRKSDFWEILQNVWHCLVREDDLKYQAKEATRRTLELIDHMAQSRWTSLDPDEDRRLYAD